MLLRGVNITEIIYIIPALVFSLCVHEFAHAYAAFKLGDTSQKTEGRMTLNPLRHIDPIGFLCLVVAGFGWAKPVQVNSANFIKPPPDGIIEGEHNLYGAKRGMAITSVMGPLSNFILAVIAVFAAYPLFAKYGVYLYGLTPHELAFYGFRIGEETISGFQILLQSSIPTAPRTVMLFLQQLSVYNLVLCAFNLIPLPPLDGSKIFSAFLEDARYFKFINGTKAATIILLILVFTRAIGYIISPVIMGMYNLIYRAAGFIF